ncbi:hypothetical protein ANN_25128, partial [Periplaneta americana]
FSGTWNIWQNVYQHSMAKVSDEYSINMQQLSSDYSSNVQQQVSWRSMRRVGGTKKFVCKKCGRGYMWSSALKRHMNLECNKEPTYQCPYYIFPWESCDDQITAVFERGSASCITQPAINQIPSSVQQYGQQLNEELFGNSQYYKPKYWSGHHSAGRVVPESMNSMFVPPEQVFQDVGTGSFDQLQQLPDVASLFNTSQTSAGRGYFKVIASSQSSEEGFRCKNCEIVHRSRILRVGNVSIFEPPEEKLQDTARNQHGQHHWQLGVGVFGSPLPPFDRSHYEKNCRLPLEGFVCTNCGKSYRLIHWSDCQEGTKDLEIIDSLEPFNETCRGVTRFDRIEGTRDQEASAVYTSSQLLATRVNFNTLPRTLNHGFICKKCGKSYNWKQSLNNHIRMECGKEPQFKCPYCPHRAKLKWNLQKHIKMRHSENRA